ncbi:uncharacterized protein RHIMIDRAFT_265828, partial [Rhizopus microsporus ATCC 52813]
FFFVSFSPSLSLSPSLVLALLLHPLNIRNMKVSVYLLAVKLIALSFSLSSSKVCSKNKTTFRSKLKGTTEGAFVKSILIKLLTAILVVDHTSQSVYTEFPIFEFTTLVGTSRT